MACPALCPVLIGPQIHGVTGELAAVVAEQHLRDAAFELQFVQRAHHIIALQALTHFDRHRLSRVDIDDGQRTEVRAIL